MGSGHPLSLKLKTNLNWLTLIYSYNDITNKEGIIKRILRQRFKRELISEIKYEYRGKGVEILIWKYKRRKEEKGIEIIERYLTEILKKEVKIRITYIKTPILNGKILGKYVSIKIRKNSFRRIRKKIKKMIRIPKIRRRMEYTYNWNKILSKYINKRIISYIRGIYIKVKGRISKKRRAKRSIKYLFKIGRFQFNSITSLIDYSNREVIGINGVYSIKICISTDIIAMRRYRGV